MKIYFSASISMMSVSDRKNCQEIVKIIEELGHKVIADHVLSKDRKFSYKDQTEAEALSIQRKLTKWKKQADIFVAEVSNPSLGVGQEIALAISLNKPVLALYHKGKKPHILKDEGKELLVLIDYSSYDLKKRIVEAIDYASEKQDTRFNFFISPKIGNYLDWIAKNKKTPRAVYLRRLIEKEMKENKEYSKS